jgi:hypothetical protein
MFPPFEEPEFAAPWEMWIRATFLHMFVIENGRWLWPTLESLHFIGLSVLFATVGVFDLRVLGLAKAIPPGTLHRLIPIGIAGYAVNVLTGTMFFSGFPEQYFYNPAFWWKGTFMAIAAINVALFYLTPEFRQVKMLPAGADAPVRAKLIAGTSLAAWSLVLICGRLLTFYRPPSFH